MAFQYRSCPLTSRRTLAVLHSTDSLRTPDGLTLFTRAWSPELGTIRADLLLVHGIGEHSGRYAHVAAHLMMHGIRVFAYDQRGHGESEGERAYIERFDSLVADLHLVRAFVDVERTEPTGPTRPLFLMGHSLGGLVVARYVSAHSSDGLAGVVLSSPALRTDVAPLLQKVSGFVSRVAPRLPTVKLDLKALSRDPRVVRNYEEDPLTATGHGVRARTGFEVIEAMKQVRPAAFDVPTYLFHGTADQITSPEASQAFVAAIPAADKSLKLYDGFYHETMNEPEKEEVLTDLTDWVLARA